MNTKGEIIAPTRERRLVVATLVAAIRIAGKERKNRTPRSVRHWMRWVRSLPTKSLSAEIGD